MKYDYENISNTQLNEMIDEWVHSERDRRIMKRRMIDGICFEPLAEEFALSERHVRKIAARHSRVIFQHLYVRDTSGQNT